jgi:hypothetical protein
MIPQKNVITLDEALTRTNYWRQAIKQYFSNGGGPAPHGFVIPLEDVLELSENYKDQGIVGVRAYFTLSAAEEPDGPPPNQVSAILVPVKAGPDNPGGEQVFLDIIINVPSLTGDDDTVSVYDVTRPCPPCCDASSPLQ